MEENKFKLIKFLKHTSIYYKKNIAKVCEEFGFSPAEGMLLLHLSKAKNKRGCDIVKSHGISKAYVSKYIKKLADRNYIIINKEELDNRYQNIIINSSAKKIIEKLQKIENYTFDKLLSNINENEKEMFFTLVDKILNNIGKEI